MNSELNNIYKRIIEERDKLKKENENLTRQLNQKNNIINDTIKTLDWLKEHYDEFLTKDYDESISVFNSKVNRIAFVTQIQAYIITLKDDIRRGLEEAGCDDGENK